MSSSENMITKRVLVALDESASGLAALDAAAHLASQIQAELHGLFVEDDNLLRLASLPFAREIDFMSAIPRPLDLPTVERTLRAKADQVRQAIATTAQRTSVRWTFQVTRGRVAQTTLAASSEVDAVIIGRESSPLRTSSDVAGPSDRDVILVVYDGSSAGQRVLEAAATLAAIHSSPIHVTVKATSEDEANNLEKEASKWLTERGVESTCAGKTLKDARDLSVLVDRTHAKLLLLNRENQLLDERSIEALVTELDCPIGLVR